jgi:hypothetical protein
MCLNALSAQKSDFWWRDALTATGNDRGAKENWSTAHESRRKGEGSDSDYGATESGFRGPHYVGGESPEESATGQEGSGGHRHSGKAERLITAKTPVLSAIHCNMANALCGQALN